LRYHKVLLLVKSGSTKTDAYNSVGVDRNTVVNQAPIAELATVSPDMFKILRAGFQKGDSLQKFAANSFITGKSVHNQIIEQLWHDVWCCVPSNYYADFRYLEELLQLDPDQDLHLICLHYMMLPRLSHHLQLFMRTWDNHSLSTERNRSLNQLWLASQVMGPHQIQNTVSIDLSYFKILS